MLVVFLKKIEKMTFAVTVHTAQLLGLWSQKLPFFKGPYQFTISELICLMNLDFFI